MSGKVWQPTKDTRIKRRGKFYWARFEKRGVVVQESLSTQNFSTAVRMTDDIENCILLGVDWHKPKEMFEDVWPAFLKAKEAGDKTAVARPKTLYEYTQFGKTKFLPFFTGKSLMEIEDAWPEFVELERTKNPEIQFANMRKYLSSFLTWCKRKKKMTEKPELFDPDAKFKAAREEESIGQAFPVDKLAAIRTEAAKEGLAFHLFTVMEQYMGMRPSEITQLAKDRIDLPADMIRLKKIDTKTKRGRPVPIHAAARALLVQQLAASGDSPFLFPHRDDPSKPMRKDGFRGPWERVSVAAGIAGRNYDHRHSFITHALLAKVDPFAVAKIAGTSIQMVQRVYSHLFPENLKAEIAKVTLT